MPKSKEDKTNPFILIEFDEETGQAKFDIHTTKNEQMLIGILGIEGYFARCTGLSTPEIRSILDTEKHKVEAKPVDEATRLSDWEKKRRKGK